MLDPIETLTNYVDTHSAYQQVRQIVKDDALLLRRYRKSKNISIRKLAPILQVSYSYLSKVETGKEALSVELATKILAYEEFCNVPPQ